MSHEGGGPRAGEEGTSVAGWPANLNVVFGLDSVGTRMVHCQHRGPLRVQRPFYPEGPGTPHLYVLHPPGGLAGGDALSISVEVGPGASVLVTTPAAGKIYRTAGRIAEQKQLLRVDRGGALEWLPQENIVFNGADALLETRVMLAPDSRFVGWEIVCLGRPASGEKFTAGRLRQRFELYQDGAPLCIERSISEGGARSLYGGFGLQGSVATGVLFATPASPKLLQIARDVALPSASSLFDCPPHLDCPPAKPPAGRRADLVSSTLVGPHGEVLCCRYLGSSAARGREHLARVWSAVRRELLGKDAVAPRIWFT